VTRQPLVARRAEELLGTAVVATNNPGAREVLQDGRAGIIVDERALGQALIRLLQRHC